MVPVPQVVGQQLNAAVELLNTAGLAVQDHVCHQQQGAGHGADAEPGRRRLGQVDDGGQTDGVQQRFDYQRPQRGRLLPTNAGSTINGSSLTVGSQTSSCSQSVATGNIASQNPAAGTQVKSGTPINLVVSNGPCSATVPDVIQETQSRGEHSHVGRSRRSRRPSRRWTVPEQGKVGTVQSQNPYHGGRPQPPVPADGHHDRL